MATKYVYLFANGKADGNGQMKDLLGGKGAGLAEMTSAGLPVPPGFTITTQACNMYYDAGQRFRDRQLRRQGIKLGAAVSRQIWRVEENGFQWKGPR